MMRPTPAADGCRTEVARSDQVAFVEALAARHAVNQVVGRADIDHSRRQGLGLQDVAGHDLDLIQPGPALQALRVAHQAADAIACLKQARHQTPTDIARGPGDK